MPSRFRSLPKFNANSTVLQFKAKLLPKDYVMGSGSLLLILAAVGVDYGWQPDGTRSRGSDNLEYIIQIAPDQIGRLQRLGEITSVLDPSISARVTKVVFRVGNGTLPRNAGDPVSAPGKSTLTPTEPRTGLNNERDEQFDTETSPLTATSRSVTDSEKIAAQTASKSTSRMKPAQQVSNGIDLPANLPSTITASSEVSTEPIDLNRTNQWTDIRNQTSPRNLIVPPPPPTIKPSDASISPTPVASQTQIEAEQPKVASWPPSQNQLDPKSYPESFPTQISNAMSLPKASVSTSPDDPKWSGYGREPDSLSRFPKENERQGLGEEQTPRTANEGKAISTTTPIGHQTGNTGQLQRDRINMTPFRPGVQSINNTSPPSDGREHWVDQYGRKLDQQGNLISNHQPGNPQEGFDQNGPYLRTPTDYQRPEFGSTSSSVGGSGFRRNENYSQENSGYPANTILDISAGQLENTATSTQQFTNGTYHSTDRSLSLERDKTLLSTKAFSTEGGSKSPGRMNAQPFFNFILLISLVGNAYLIYETGNLRRKFRSMISAIRTTKITPQGA